MPRATAISWPLPKFPRCTPRMTRDTRMYEKPCSSAHWRMVFPSERNLRLTCSPVILNPIDTSIAVHLGFIIGTFGAMSTPIGAHDRLREERIRLGYNQTEFSAVAGTTQRSQTVYETGKRSPDLEYLAAIATIGADVQYIATGKRTVANSVPVDAMEKAISTAFEMIKTSGVEVTSGQFVQMVKTLLPQPAAVEDQQPGAPGPGGGHPSMGHGNMIASGSGITQVGGRISISRGGKMKSN